MPAPFPVTLNQNHPFQKFMDKLSGPYNLCDFRVKFLNCRFKVALCSIQINVSVKVIAESILNLLIASLVISGNIAHINGRSHLGEQCNMILAP